MKYLALIVLLFSAPVFGQMVGPTPTATGTPIVGMHITPVNPDIRRGQTVQLKLYDTTGTLVESGVTWSSATPEVATVSATGLVSTMDTGTVQIIATYKGQIESSMVTITP